VHRDRGLKKEAEKARYSTVIGTQGHLGVDSGER
jgi:hypothetical protein